MYQSNAKLNVVFWISEVRKAFGILNARLISGSLLAVRSTRGPFIVYTDAIQHEMGAVLTQLQNGSERVFYASRSVIKTQRQNSTVKQRFLATVNFTKNFKPYLLERRLEFVFYHRAFHWPTFFRSFRWCNGTLTRKTQFQNRKLSIGKKNVS